MTQTVHVLLVEAAGETPPLPPPAEIERRGRRQRRNFRLSGAVALAAAAVAALVYLPDAGAGRVRSVDPVGTPEAGIGQPVELGSDAALGGVPARQAAGPGVSVPGVDTTLPPVTLPTSRPAPPASFTPPPPGTRLFFVSQSKLVSTRLDGTDRRVVVDRLVVPIAISDDGARMLASTWDTSDKSVTLSILDLVTGNRVQVVRRESNDIWGADLSADGRTVVYSVANDALAKLTSDSPPYDVHVVNADGTGDRVVGHGTDPVWSPDAGLILLQFCADDGTGAPCTIKPDGSDRRVLPHTLPSGPLAWSPDGRWLAGRGTDGRLSVARPDGSELHVVGREMVPSRPAWTPDGKHVVYMRAGDGRYDITGECEGHCAAYGLASAALDDDGEAQLTNDQNDGFPAIARHQR